MQDTFQNRSSRDYITGIDLNGARIIPSDSFELGENEYILLEILKTQDAVFYLELLCIDGPYMGNRYRVPHAEFENKGVSELEILLADYHIN